MQLCVQTSGVDRTRCAVHAYAGGSAACSLSTIVSPANGLPPAVHCCFLRTVHWYSAHNTGGIYEFMADSFKEMYHPDLKSAEGLPEVACVPLMYILDK